MAAQGIGTLNRMVREGAIKLRVDVENVVEISNKHENIRR
jgi:hypothetical protein